MKIVVVVGSPPTTINLRLRTNIGGVKQASMCTAALQINDQHYNCWTKR